MDDIIIYNCIHKKLNEKVNCTRLMRKRDLYFILAVTYKTPKKIIPLIMKEMEECNIIKDVNKQFIEVKPFKDDIEQKANKLYEKMGIF